MAKPPKLILTVIDGMKPTMVERAMKSGSAPALKAIVDRGVYVPDCVAAFPSVTPVCAATIATGRLQDEHEIPSMNWYSRAEQRYVEYGSSFSASRKFGLNRQLVDTIFNMNATHLAPDVLTVFERLDDIEAVRTACTSYLIYRGRHAHEISRDFALTRAASSLFKRSTMGPLELFYADIFASRTTGCWSRMGIPGMRDQHGGCVGTYLVEHDLFDFLLLSLPDNDAHSHKYGPHAQIKSIAAADAELWRVMEAGGGAERFLDEHAMIVMADHSHSHIEQVIDLTGPLSDWRVLPPSGAGARTADIALCPAQRSAMIYLLGESRASSLRADRGDGAGDRGRRPRHVVGGRPRADRRRARRAVVRPRRRDRRRARPALVGRRRARDAAGDDRRRRPALRPLPRRARARVGGDALPDVRRRAALGRARLRVPRLG